MKDQHRPVAMTIRVGLLTVLVAIATVFVVQWARTVASRCAQS